MIVTKTKKSFLIFAAIFVLISCLFFVNDNVYATMYKKPVPVKTSEIISSKNFEGEYYKVRTPLDEKNVIYVEGRTKTVAKRLCIRLTKHKGSSYITAFVVPNENGEFSIKISTKKGTKSVPEVIDGKGTVSGADDTYATTPGYNAVQLIPAGTYHLTITRATTDKDADISKGVTWYNGQLGGTKGYAYKDAVLTVSSGDANNPKLVKYSDAMVNNKNIRNLYEKKSYSDSSYEGSYVRYKDNYMRDIGFVFTNPKTKKSSPMTAARVNYIKNVSNIVTSQATSDYEKLLKIYEYTADNFYYDNLAFSKKMYQYSNPYLNIYNLRNKIKSANSTGGKVATTCQGYSAIVVALARAQGIPTRFVTGHHISQPVTVWADKKDSDISKMTHYWAEAYVDGRWVIIDANSGTYSKWDRTSFSGTGVWSKGITTYAGFDISDEQIANTYIYNTIYKGSDAGKYICRDSEVKQLKTFLNRKSYGISNGKRLNSKYSQSDYSTWGTGKLGNFTTNGYGRVSKISWGNKKLYGPVDFSNFSALKYLTLYSNKINSIKLDGCNSLIYLSSTYNNLTTFNGTGAPKLATISLKGNKLTTAKFKYYGRTINIKRNIKKGSFGFNYNKANKKKITIFAANAPRGYKYLGIYNGYGKRLTKYKTYTFNPSAANTYYVKYAKK